METSKPEHSAIGPSYLGLHNSLDHLALFSAVRTLQQHTATVMVATARIVAA